jgi:hypothetical protein
MMATALSNFSPVDTKLMYHPWGLPKLPKLKINLAANLRELTRIKNETRNRGFSPHIPLPKLPQMLSYVENLPPQCGTSKKAPLNRCIVGTRMNTGQFCQQFTNRQYLASASRGKAATAEHF